MVLSLHTTTTVSFVLFMLVWVPFPCIAKTEPKRFLNCLSGYTSPLHPMNNVIYTPENPLFISVFESAVRNRRYSTNSTPKPLVIVAPKHESHVQATVLCAKETGLQIRIRSGGHDYDALSYVSQVPFVLLDMFNLRYINVDIEDESAHVQAGATLGELYYSITNKSNVHGFPGGVCFNLGIGGHFSGGGYGTMMRKYGLTVDNIIDAEIVDANGRILDRESMGEDLFWAIRGGGGASFGVILSFKIKLVPVPEKVTVFRVDRTLEEGATEVVWKWQNVAHKIDENLFIRLMLDVVNGTEPGKKTIRASCLGMFLGDKESLLSVVEQSFPEMGLQANSSSEVQWRESLMLWSNHKINETDEQSFLDRGFKVLVRLKRKSDYVKTPISRTDLESIWKIMIELEDVGMAWNPYGGKMSEIPASATPFPHRAGNIFKIQYSSNWLQAGDDYSERRINLTRILYEAMTPYVSKNPREAFLNYRDIDIGSLGSAGNCSYHETSDFGHKYFKQNFERLVYVKTRVDPDNFFRYEQSIPTRVLLERRSSGHCNA